MCDHKKILVAASLTTGALFAQSLYNYYKNRPAEDFKDTEKGFVDSAFSEARAIQRSDAFIRSSCISNVSYQLALALVRGGEDYQGQVIIRFQLGYLGNDLALDYKGKQLK